MENENSHCVLLETSSAHPSVVVALLRCGAVKKERRATWSMIDGACEHLVRRFRKGRKCSQWELLELKRSRVLQAFQGAFVSTSDRVQDSRSIVSEKLRGAQSIVSDMSAVAIDGIKRFVDGCKTEVGRIAQRLKHD
uniref:Uncharacterized protein n=1 Tax=Physcomitrium patens TaxID=3218 RepID=A9SNL7_PHYPA|nr:hypothetical protein PHYPA_022139 [Physcomitrium patens]